MINKNDLRKAISSIAISNAKRNTIYKAFSDLDSITKEEFDSVKSDISKVVESMLTKDTVGKANGVASLDSNGSVPIEQLGNIDTTLFLIVRELPTVDIKSNKIYLVPNQDGQGNNVYIEYLYVEDVWEKLGEFKPDIDYNEILNKVKEITVCKGNSHNINGGFDDNGNKNADAAYDCIDIGFNNKQKLGEGTIFIGSENTQTSNGDYNFCIGCNNNVHDSTTTIGQNIDFGKISNSIGIGEYINMDDHDGGMYNIIIGSYDNENNANIPNGFISVGYTPYNINHNDIIYQIGGYDPINEDAYNLETTLTLEHEHKKYIYGIGNYNGTNINTAKSLQEVLNEKANTSAIPTKTSQLTNDSSFATEDYVSNSIEDFKTMAIIYRNEVIYGLFNSNNEKIDVDLTAGSSIIIGFDNTGLDTIICNKIISIGNNIIPKGSKSIYIGESIDVDGYNSIAIGRDIRSNSDKTVIIGSNGMANTLDGYIGIGYDITENTNAIYQIAGHGGDNQYSLEETLTYDNQHKKYIYGIGGYDGTNSNVEGVKSLQEVLADKADVSDYYTKTEIDDKGYLTAHQSLDNCVKIGNDTTPTQLFKGQGSATINAKQLLLNSPSGGVNIQPDSINIGSSSFTFKANPTEGLGFIVNTASKGVILTPQGGVNSIGFNAKDAIVQKGGSLVGQDVSGAVYNVNGNFVNLNPLYNLESKFRDTIAIHVALDNITDASTPEEVVTKFNQLLKSLKAIGLMKPDATAE